MSPKERPATSAERVFDAVRAGHRTSETIIRETGLNPSIVGIALTKLHKSGAVTRRLANYQEGQPGKRPYIYDVADSGEDVAGGGPQT